MSFKLWVKKWEKINNRAIVGWWELCEWRRWTDMCTKWAEWGDWLGWAYEINQEVDSRDQWFSTRSMLIVSRRRNRWGASTARSLNRNQVVTYIIIINIKIVHDTKHTYVVSCRRYSYIKLAFKHVGRARWGLEVHRQPISSLRSGNWKSSVAKTTDAAWNNVQWMCKTNCHCEMMKI